MDLALLVEQALEQVSSAADENALIQVKASFLGRNGVLSDELRGLGKLPKEERAARGGELNVAKKRIEEAVAARHEVLHHAAAEQQLSEAQIDVTLPAQGLPLGHAHPLTLVEDELIALFSGMGFEWVDGPEVETEAYNFDSLNMPSDHPAREMQDTFYVEDGIVLRTHTSPVQIRAMEGRTPPLRVFTTGRVYRHDSSTRHSPMFHQIEGFLVDDRVTFTDLKGTLFAVVRELFGADVKIRFRRSFFPFTEPSGEIDIWRDGKWLEILGCGMVHPNVLKAVGIDPEKCQGYAFGAGIDRIAMLKYGLEPIRVLFENDQRVLNQF